MLEELDRRADLADVSVLVEHRKAVGYGERDFLVVRDVEDRDALSSLERPYLEAHLLAQVRVEVRQRFVEKHYLRLGDQRAGERDALLLSAGELRRQAFLKAGEVDAVDGLLCAPRGLFLLHLLHLQRIVDVFSYRHVRPDRVVLEDDAERALVRRHHYLFRRRRLRHAAYLHRSGVGRLEARYHAQHDGLAAAGGAEQRKAFAVVYREVEVLVNDFLAVSFAHMLKFYFGQTKQLLSSDITMGKAGASIGPSPENQRPCAREPRAARPRFVSFKLLTVICRDA